MELVSTRYLKKKVHNNVKVVLYLLSTKNDVIVNCIKIVYTFDIMELTMIIIIVLRNTNVGKYVVFYL